MTVPLLSFILKEQALPAASMENQVPEDVIKDRFDRLLKLVQQKASEAFCTFYGFHVERFQMMSKKNPNLLKLKEALGLELS